MVQVITGRSLSGSTNGKPIKIVAVATAGTTVHTAVTGTTDWDEVYIFLTNTSTAPVTVTVEWGAVTDPDGHLVKAMLLPANSAPIPVATGQRIQNAMVCAVFASAANVVTATGWVNRLSGT